MGKQQSDNLSREDFQREQAAPRRHGGVRRAAKLLAVLVLVFAVVLALTIAISAIELRRGRTIWLYDAVLLTLDGLAGLCLFMMIFSYHPTVQVNMQLLLLNPLSILMVYPVGKSAIRHRYNRYWTVLFICLLLFLVSTVFQHPAEGMPFLACSLMVRCYMNYKLYNHKEKQLG